MVAPAVVAAGVGAAIQGAQAIGSYRRSRRLQKEMDGMPDPRFTPNNQLLSYYNQALQETVNPQGLTTQERGAAYNDIARNETVARTTAQTIGAPGSSVNYLVNAINNNGRNNLTRIDANRRFGNRQGAFGRVGSAVNMFQSLDNQNTGLDIQKQEALGKAISDSRMTANYALGNLGNAAFGASGMLYGNSTPSAAMTAFQQPTTTAPTMGYQPNVMNQYNPQLPSGFRRLPAYGRNSTWQGTPYMYQ